MPSYDKDSKLKQSRRRLYNAVRKSVDPSLQSDTGFIKSTRDEWFAKEMNGMKYSHARPDEMIYVANLLYEDLGLLPKGSAHKVFASDEALKKLRFLAFRCAIEYCNFDEIQYVVAETGEYYEGEELRNWLKNKYSENKNTFGQIPHLIFQHVYNNWINPKFNEIAKRKEWKKFVKSKKWFNMTELDPKQANHLITVFQQMDNNINQMDAPGFDENAVKN
jgi:hypothetical protein